MACAGIDPCKVLAETAGPTDPLTNVPITWLKEGKGGANVKVVGVFATNYDVAQVPGALLNLLQANADANVLVGIADDTALAAYNVIKSRGLAGKIKVIGNSSSSDGVEAIKAGKLFGTIAQWPRTNGEKAADMLVSAVRKEKITDPGLVVYELPTPQLITKDNADQFKAQW